MKSLIGSQTPGFTAFQHGTREGKVIIIPPASRDLNAAPIHGVRRVLLAELEIVHFGVAIRFVPQRPVRPIASVSAASFVN